MTNWPQLQTLDLLDEMGRANGFVCVRNDGYWILHPHIGCGALIFRSWKDLHPKFCYTIPVVSFTIGPNISLQITYKQMLKKAVLKLSSGSKYVLVTN